MFEPYHPLLAKEFKTYNYHQYFDKLEENDPILLQYNRVFKGQYYSERVERNNHKSVQYNKAYKHLLVKDIYANLFTHSVFVHLKEIKIILLIRNPFAVCSSIMERKEWGWPNDISLFLEDQHLMKNHLHLFRDLMMEIHKTGSYLEKQMLVWSIINYVPIKQFQPQEMYILFYDKLRENPIHELGLLFEFIDNKKQIFEMTEIEELLNRPSRVSRGGMSKQNEWKDNYSEKEIKRCLDILEKFEFDKLYNFDKWLNAV